MKRLLLVFAAAVLSVSAGCATHGAATDRSSTAASHEGVYEFRAETEGMPALTGAITVRRGNDGYTGAITTEVFPPIPLVSVSEQDGLVTLVGRTDEGEVTFRIRFSGASFTGEWNTSDGLGGRATGTRRPLG
jgi:hypothetical protein